MGEILFFVLGLVVGTMAGVTIMCLFQINKINKIERKEHTNERK